MRATTRRHATALCALVTAFVASRLAWLRWNPDSASYWEESYRWAAVDLWHSGVWGTFLDLQADHYQGGSLVMIALTDLAFRLLGPSFLALKLVAVGFSTLTLALLFETLRRFFGGRAATLAGAAYVAGPPLVAFWGLVVMGSHGESVASSLLQLLVFLGIVSGVWRSARGFFAFGLASGLGLWFCFTAGLSLLACALTWLLLERLPRARELASATLGGVVGLLPWLAYNATHGFAGLERLLQLFGARPQIDPWPAQGVLEKAAELGSHVLPVALLQPSAWGPPDGLPLALAFTFGAVSVPALLAAVERVVSALWLRPEPGSQEYTRSRLELVFLVYPVVFLCVYLASRYAVDVPGTLGYRIFTPFAVLLSVPIAISLADASRAGGLAGFAARTASAAWLASLAAATLLFASDEREGRREVSEANGYRALGVLLQRKHAPDLTPSLVAVRRLPDPERRAAVRFGLGWSLQSRHEMGAPLSELEAALASVPDDERTEVLNGVRWSLLQRGALFMQPNAASPLVRAQRERNEALAAFLAERMPPEP